MQHGVSKVDLIPPQIHKLGRTEAVAICNQYHRRVAVPPAVLLCRLDKLFDLGRRQVLTGAEFAVWPP
jgi:hypothetical protein